MRTCTFALVLLLIGTDSAQAATNEECLACHGSSQMSGKNGSLYIDPVQFADTTHASVGCSACHTSVDPVHSEGKKPVSKANCKDCHEETWNEYNRSVHANNATCSDCHNPHAVRGPLSVSGTYINNQCAKCHERQQTVETHARWLPQSSLHMDAMPCIACHTGSKDYVITLFIEKKKPGSSTDEYIEASAEDLAKFVPAGKQVRELVDTNNDGKISLDELRRFNHGAKDKGMRLWGMLMPETMTHSYQILRNRWDCTFCHATGPDARQTSYVAFPQVSKKYERMEVQKGAILDLVFGTPDFYMVGSTRSRPLSILGLLIVVGGAAFPLSHGTFRFLTRHNRRRKKEHDV